MKELLNDRVKRREPFRPYAPAVLDEKAAEYFDMSRPSPYMLLAPRVREGKRAVIPAVTHVDGTARVQSVSRESNPRFWSLIKAFEDATGVAVVINTSFNLRGEPIVGAPEDAAAVYKNSAMDMLAVGNAVVER